MPNNEKITPFGIVNFRSQENVFGIKIDDRRRHMYVIGKTGMAKTTLLESMTRSDIENGNGFAVVDPHGGFAEGILKWIPEHRIKDVVYFNPADMKFPIAFNPLEQVGTEYRHLVAAGMMGVFKKIWVDMWSARMEYILNNTLLALLEYPGSNLLGIQRMLSDKEYRKKVVDNLKDPVVKGFWVNEFAKYSQKFETEATASIQNKVGQLVSNPLVRNILGQSHSTINIRKIMDEGKILIVNLSKGRIGEDNSALLGAMVITKIQLAAMSRVDIPEEERKDFFLYIDEFQNFATASFANILSEARKYRLSLILAHQYIRQLVTESNTMVRDAIFGNVGTIVTFRVGAEDAEFLEKEFQPDFMANDIVNIPKYNFYTKLMIDGIASKPFSASTIPPIDLTEYNLDDKIIEHSRKTYGTPVDIVSAKIAEGFKPEEDSGYTEKKPFKKREFSSNKFTPRPSSGYSDKKEYQPRKFTPKFEKSTTYSEPSPRGEAVDRSFSDRREKPVERKIFSNGNPLSSVLKPKPEKEKGPIIRKFSPSDRPEKKKVNLGDLRAALAKSLERSDLDEVKDDSPSTPEAMDGQRE